MRFTIFLYFFVFHYQMGNCQVFIPIQFSSQSDAFSLVLQFSSYGYDPIPSQGTLGNISENIDWRSMCQDSANNRGHRYIVYWLNTTGLNCGTLAASPNQTLKHYDFQVYQLVRVEASRTNCTTTVNVPSLAELLVEFMNSTRFG